MPKILDVKQFVLLHIFIKAVLLSIFNSLTWNEICLCARDGHYNWLSG